VKGHAVLVITNESALYKTDVVCNFHVCGWSWPTV